MGSSYTSLHFHIVFSTKQRRGIIAMAWRPRLHEYLGGTVRGLGAWPKPWGESRTMCTSSLASMQHTGSRISCEN